MNPTWQPSPNHDARTRAVDMVVIHYTDMTSAGAAVAWLCNPQSHVSAHYLVARGGEVIQMVAEENRAWHAGVSHWRGVQDNNGRSIGIELDSRGHRGSVAPVFPVEQISATLRLLDGIRHRHDIPCRNVVAHSDIAPHRKVDPGERFPWDDLATNGHALPTAAAPPPGAALSDSERQVLAARLCDIGYAPALSKTDEVFAPIAQKPIPAEAAQRPSLLPAASDGWLWTAVIDAFHRRFLPARVGTAADQGTLTAAQSVAAAILGEDGRLPPPQLREEL